MISTPYIANDWSDLGIYRERYIKREPGVKLMADSLNGPFESKGVS